MSKGVRQRTLLFVFAIGYFFKSLKLNQFGLFLSGTPFGSFAWNKSDYNHVEKLFTYYS